MNDHAPANFVSPYTDSAEPVAYSDQRKAKEPEPYMVFDPRANKITVASAVSGFIVDASSLRKKFTALVKAWKKETALLSFTQQKTRVMTFLQIIALGEPVLSLIFEEFAKTEGSAWPTALEAITIENPAKGLTDFQKIIDAWFEWAEDNGYWRRSI